MCALGPLCGIGVGTGIFWCCLLYKTFVFGVSILVFRISSCFWDADFRVLLLSRGIGNLMVRVIFYCFGSLGALIDMMWGLKCFGLRKRGRFHERVVRGSQEVVVVETFLSSHGVVGKRKRDILCLLDDSGGMIRDTKFITFSRKVDAYTRIILMGFSSILVVLLFYRQSCYAEEQLHWNSERRKVR